MAFPILETRKQDFKEQGGRIVRGLEVFEAPEPLPGPKPVSLNFFFFFFKALTSRNLACFPPPPLTPFLPLSFQPGNWEPTFILTYISVSHSLSLFSLGFLGK